MQNSSEPHPHVRLGSTRAAACTVAVRRCTRGGGSSKRELHVLGLMQLPRLDGPLELHPQLRCDRAGIREYLREETRPPGAARLAPGPSRACEQGRRPWRAQTGAELAGRKRAMLSRKGAAVEREENRRSERVRW